MMRNKLKENQISVKGNQGDYQKPCTRSGYKHGDGKDSCPAIGKVCGLCNKPNHFQKVCSACCRQ